jgi:Polyketide cyclase / dehydrase and lipid transport
MKILKWIGTAIALFIAGGFFMPGMTHVERSIDINAPSAAVFNQINEFKNWVNWSPWYKLDPKMALTYSQPSAGIGAKYNWASENKDLGKGQMTILDTKTNEKVQIKLLFDNHESLVDFKLVAKDSLSTQVTWNMNIDNGLNPLSRWVGLGMDKFMGPDFEKGLADIKAFCERTK